jgi:uncharacterized protein GlcG (DUF336 family)
LKRRGAAFAHLPLLVNGKVIGASGCSGGTAAQDGQACRAGADTVKWSGAG